MEFRELFDWIEKESDVINTGWSDQPEEWRVIKELEYQIIKKKFKEKEK